MVFKLWMFFVTVALVLVAVSNLIHVMYHPDPDKEVRIWQIGGTQYCYEDESCWDCETMGNQNCGPQE